MLTRRLIITLTLNEGSLFRTKKCTPDRLYTLNFVDLELADEMVILDITRDNGDSAASWDRARDLAGRLFLPLCLGGHVRSVDMARWLMRDCGADKIIINHEAIRRPEFITELAHKIGSQSVVVAIDAKGTNGINSRPTVWTNQGTEDTGRCPVMWASEAQSRGAGEIYLTDIDRDGSLQGYNLEWLRLVSRCVSIPVVISGGCGAWNHMDEAFEAGADACSTSCIFHFSERGMGAMKEKLAERGHRMRMA